MPAEGPERDHEKDRAPADAQDDTGDGSDGALEIAGPSENAGSPPPLAAPVGRDRFYSTRLRQLARLDLEEKQAETLWHGVARHRIELRQALGRDVGQRVALLDYIVNVRPQLTEPQIIDKTALDNIEHQALVDALTGLFNRRYLEMEVARHAELCVRYGGPLSLLLMDLDHFKEVNDRFGHPIGDRVLQRVGSLLTNSVRAPAVACRLGGDEFAVIMPDAPSDEAHIVAERIRAQIHASFERDPVSGHYLPVTSSGGIGALGPGVADAETLFAAADRALYEAKAAGGNQVVTAGPPEDSAPPAV